MKLIEQDQERKDMELEININETKINKNTQFIIQKNNNNNNNKNHNNSNNKNKKRGNERTNMSEDEETDKNETDEYHSIESYEDNYNKDNSILKYNIDNDLMDALNDIQNEMSETPNGVIININNQQRRTPKFIQQLLDGRNKSKTNFIDFEGTYVSNNCEINNQNNNNNNNKTNDNESQDITMEINQPNIKPTDPVSGPSAEV